MIDLGVLRGLAILEDKFSPVMGQINKSMGGTMSTAEVFGKNMTKLGTTMAPVSLAIGGVGIASVKMATDLNASLANVSALLTNLSGPQLDKTVGEMKTKVQGLAVDLGKSTTDVSGGLYEVISSLGLTNDTFSQLEISAKAGAAGLASTQEAFNFLSAVTKTYGDTSEAAFKKVGDLGFQAVNIGQTTFPQLASSIGNIAPLAKTAGVSLEEMFAVIATATGVTGNTAEVTTQMASAVNALLNPSKDLKALYKEIGVEGGQAAIAQFGLVGSLQKVAEFSERTRTPMLDLLGRKEAFIITANLAGEQAAKFTDNLNKMGDAAKANGEIVGDAFEKQTQGVNKFGFELQVLRSRLEVAGQKLGDVLIRALADFSKWGTIVVDIVLKMVDGFSKLPQPVQTVGIAILAMVALAAPALIALGFAAQGASIALSGIGAGVKIAQGALFTLGNTVPVLTARIAFMEGGFVGLFKVLSGFAGAFGTKIAGFFTPIIAGFTNLSGMLTGLGGILSTAGTALLTFFSGPVGAGVLAITALVSGLRILHGSWDFITVPLKFAGQVLLEVGRLVKDFAISIGTDLVKHLREAGRVLGVWWADIKGVASSITSLLVPAIRTLLDPLGLWDSSLGGIIDKLKWIIGNAQAAAVAANIVARAVIKNATGIDIGADKGPRDQNLPLELKPLPSNLFVGPEFIPFTGPTQKKTSAGEAANWTEDQLKSLQKTADQFSGKALAQEIREIETSVKMAGGAAKMTAFEKKKLGDQLKDIVAQGGKLPPVLHKIFVENVSLKDIVPRVTTGLDAQELGLRNVWRALDEGEEKYINIRDAMRKFNAEFMGSRDIRVPNVGDALTIDMKEFEETTKRVLHETRTLSMRIKDEWKQTFEDLPSLILKAIQGGGNIGQAIGAQFGTSIMKALVGNLDANTGLFTSGVGKWLQGVFGKSTGGLAASLMPALGSLMGMAMPLMDKGIKAAMGTGIAGTATSWAAQGLLIAGPWGAAAGAIAGAIKGAFNRAANDTKKAREEFAKGLGLENLGALYDKLRTMGKEGQALANAGLNLVGKKDEAANRRWMEDVGALIEKIEKKARDLTNAFNDLGSSLGSFGGKIPASLRPLVDEILAMKGLSDDQRKALQDLAGEPAWETIRDKMEQYGIASEAAGQKFHQARITDAALQIKRDIDLLTDAGVDATGMLQGMADELLTLAADAVKTGVTLPRTLEPFLIQLDAMGLNVDEAGNKLVDLGQVQFADILDDQLIRIGDLLEDIRDLLRDDLPAAAKDGVSGVNDELSRIEVPKSDYRIRIGVDYDYGELNPEAKPQLAGGTPGGRAAYWGTGTDVTLHGWEAVVPERDLQARSGATTVNLTVPIIAWDGESVNTYLERGGAKVLARAIVPEIPREVEYFGEA